MVKSRGDIYYDYHEIKEHAGREFPFNIYPCSIPLDFKQVQVHWHEEMEIIAVKKGRGTVMVDKELLQVETGEFVAVFPGQLHGIAQWEEDVMEYENIIFRPSMLMSTEADICTLEFLKPLTGETVHRTLHIKKGSMIYEAFRDCIRQLDSLSRDKGYGYQMGVKGALFQCLYLIVGSGNSVSAPRPLKSREKMKQLLEYIETHYGERITVEDGAALCYYSHSHFMKYFKQYMGMPFTRYLNDFRLAKAGELLLTTTEPVTAVAGRCGFDNISYFNRIFRQKYHRTPGEYRRSVGNHS